MRAILVLFALCLAVPAAAQKGVKVKGKKRVTVKKKGAGSADSIYEVKSVEVTSVRGKRFELQAKLYKPGRQATAPFAVYFVDGRRKNRVYRKSDARFSGSRGGFTNSITVDLSRYNPRRGHLEAVIPGCRAAKCKKVVHLRGGDLFIDGRPTIESPTPSERVLKLKVKNAGPNPMGRCKVAIEVDGRKVGEVPFRNVAINGNKSIEYRFRRAHLNKPYKAKIACSDLGSGNNVLSGRVR